jgi:hypothetical protein
MLDATRIISVRPSFGYMHEFIQPMSFKSYDLYDGLLTTIFGGQFVVEYLARYPYGNYPTNYNQTDITDLETDFKFKLKGNHKKGTLKLSLLTTLATYELIEDMTGYKVIPSLFTFDTITNILTVNSILGTQIKTGTQLKVKTTNTLPTPLLIDTVYYAIKISNTEIKLAENIDNAYANIEIDLSGTSSGVISIESIVDLPYIYLLGTFGYAKLNLQNLEVELTLVGNYTGRLSVVFKSLYLGVDRLDIQKDPLFVDLFKSKLMQSVGLIKEILKLPDLPFDFTPDNIYNRGKEIEKETMELLYDQSDWYLFRS